MFRREWRQQLLVMALLAVAVAAAVAGASAGRHLPPPPESRFGTATQRWTTDGPDMAAVVAGARDRLGPVELIGHRELPVPGSARTVEMRAQDPHGRYGAPMLRLLAGRYPAAPAEVAVTDGAASAFGVRVGARLAVDGRTWTVVGLVENPGNLRGEFVLGRPDGTARATSVTVLAAADRARFASFRQAYGLTGVEVRQPSDPTAAVAGVFALLVVAMLLICLIAAAGFAVVAHRRMRQLGLFAAVGATARQQRLVLLVDGTVVGVVGAAVGTAAGIALWLGVSYRWETAVAHRVDRLSLPWGQIAVAMLLAVGTATVAAWRPARAAARVPVTRALSARPPQPGPARRAVVPGGLLLVAGVGCLAQVGRSNPLLGQALRVSELALLLAAAVAIGFGLLSVGPLAVRGLGAAAGRLPVTLRLALRDLGRQSARSGAALAAICLALAIPVGAVVLVRAAESRDDPAGLAALRWTIIGAGAVLALAVLGMTVGLIRAEAAADLPTLVATGATDRIRRALTAATAGGLALLGAVLGTAVAYAGLAAVSGSQVGVLGRVPVLELVVTVVGVPLVAAVAGWILAVRRPGSLIRVRLE
jgi:putative ABC transport system permease protein